MNGKHNLHTQWFNAAEYDPARHGYYEVRHRKPARNGALKTLHGSRLRYWDGKAWRGFAGSSYLSIMGSHPDHQWRGLTKKHAYRTQDMLKQGGLSHGM
jgi:hypothetical protein